MEFSDDLIRILLTVKIQYKMPYRMLEGFSRFFFEQIKKSEGSNLLHAREQRSSCHSSTIIVDITGGKVQGEGGWKVKIHGQGRSRKWLKLHVAIDTRTQDIIGEISTDASTDDGKAFPGGIRQVSHHVKTVIGDGAYDDRDVRDLIQKTTFSRYKKMFGERAFSRTRERLIVENRLKCVLVHKMRRVAA